MVLLAKKYVDEVIVIDDGSKDRTSEIAKLAGANVKRHPFNKGKGAALKSGFGAARRSDIIITLDGDGQHDPDEIPKLLEPIMKGLSDFVIGSRYINGNRKITPLYRRAGQIVLDWITNKICGASYKGYSERVQGIFQTCGACLQFQTKRNGDRERNANGCLKSLSYDQ